MQINDVVSYELTRRVAIITADNPPVNALSAAVRQGLAEGVRLAMTDAAVEALVIICAGRTFFAGADITEFGKPQQFPNLRDLLGQIEAATKPVVAAIHGAALGGGLELALVAHYRIAVPSAKAGLPEVKLGLLAGAGGTQRLPRVIGVTRALEVMTEGSQIGAREDEQLGLFDALATEDSLREDAVAFAERIVAQRLPLAAVRDRDEKLAEARDKPELFDDFRRANARRFRGFKAPEAIIQAVQKGLDLPFDEALKHERALFDDLMADSQSAAQRHVFFAERQAGKSRGAAGPVAPLSIERVGVIGAGTMGGGIAMNFLNVGIPVTIVEARQEALDRGTSVIRRNYETTARKGKLTSSEVEARMGLLKGSVDMADLSDCDLIIEAVFEQLDVKNEVFASLDAIAKPGAILATNTSYLDVDAIASATSRPEWVLGLHFFSPANVMRLLEIVRASKTSDQVLATATKLAKTIGKVGVVVGNGFGFVGNRMLAARHREAEKLILEGAAPWDVDRVLFDFGFPMGPFAMRDLVGLDVGWDPGRTSSSTVREILNEMGRHGQKTGGGFYDYDEARKATPSPIAQQVIHQFAEQQGVRRRGVSDEEILERTIYAMVNEGAKILEEGIAARPSDIDIVWISGYGWPAYRGGPMFWADLQGLPHVLQRLESLQAAHGGDFTPAPLLQRLAADGKSFAELGQEHGA